MLRSIIYWHVALKYISPMFTQRHKHTHTCITWWCITLWPQRFHIVGFCLATSRISSAQICPLVATNSHTSTETKHKPLHYCLLAPLYTNRACTWVTAGFFPLYLRINNLQLIPVLCRSNSVSEQRLGEQRRQATAGKDKSELHNRGRSVHTRSQQTQCSKKQKAAIRSPKKKNDTMWKTAPYFLCSHPCASNLWPPPGYRGFSPSTVYVWITSFTLTQL